MSDEERRKMTLENIESGEGLVYGYRVKGTARGYGDDPDVLRKVTLDVNYTFSGKDSETNIKIAGGLESGDFGGVELEYTEFKPEMHRGRIFISLRGSRYHSCYVARMRGIRKNA